MAKQIHFQQQRLNNINKHIPDGDDDNNDKHYKWLLFEFRV